MKIRIGTRRSKLATVQTEMAAKALQSKFSDISTELVPIVTHGDRTLDKPLAQIGGKGVFVEEIERALLDGVIDAAVHSAKDLPIRLAEGTEISAVLPRANPCDVLVTRKGSGVAERHKVNRKIIVGTGSQRRRIAFGRFYEDAEFKDIRGNVDTRLRKLADGEYDALVLAAAGLERLGLLGDERFDFCEWQPEKILPAPCQGIIAIQCKCGSSAAELFRTINDSETFLCFETEREVLRLMNAGCTMPVGAYSRVNSDKIQLLVTKDSLTYSMGEATITERFELAERLVNML